MPVVQQTRPVTQPAAGHGDEKGKSFTFCNIACERCDQLMAERSIEIQAGVFASAFGNPGERGWIEAYNRYRNNGLARLDASIRTHNRFQPNNAFNGAFDKGRIGWVDDLVVAL